MKRKNATILISICIVVNALNIALLSVTIMDKNWFLFTIVLILFACCTMLIRELNKLREEQDLTI